MKYKSKKTEINGHKFRSQIEGRIYRYLIENGYNIVEFEPTFILQEKFELDGKKYREIKYKSDFLIELENGQKIIIEVKGFETPEWKLKKKLFLYKFRQIRKTYGIGTKFIVVKSIKSLVEKLKK